MASVQIISSMNWGIFISFPICVPFILLDKLLWLELPMKYLSNKTDESWHPISFLILGGELCLAPANIWCKLGLRGQGALTTTRVQGPPWRVAGRCQGGLPQYMRQKASRSHNWQGPCRPHEEFWSISQEQREAVRIFSSRWTTNCWAGVMLRRQLAGKTWRRGVERF